MWDLLNDVGYWDRWGMSLTKHILPVVPLVWWELVGETPTSHQNKLVELILKTASALNDNIIVNPYLLQTNDDNEPATCLP